MPRLAQIPISERTATTKDGPVRILTDPNTGHSVEIPLPGYTGDVFSETILDMPTRERVCDSRSMRIIRTRAPGGRILLCCPVGKFDPTAVARPGVTPGVCERGFLIRVGIVHPVARASVVEREFRTGERQRKARREFDKIKRAGL